MNIPLGVQLWSVRDEIKDKGMADVLSRIARMGFSGIEFAGYYDLPAAEVKKILGDNGLKACGAHVGLDKLEGPAQAGTIEYHQAIGCEWLIIPGLDARLRDSEANCVATAQRLTKVCEQLRPHGLKAGFHLHDADIKPLAGGKSAWYHLAEHTPADFIMQFDTGNAMQGGADPVKPLLDFPGRGLSTHLKEFPIDGTPVGLGVVPWLSVLDATRRVAGTTWHVIEIEQYSKYAPMEAVAACYAATKTLLRFT